MTSNLDEHASALDKFARSDLGKNANQLSALESTLVKAGENFGAEALQFIKELAETDGTRVEQFGYGSSLPQADLHKQAKVKEAMQLLYRKTGLLTHAQKLFNLKDGSYELLQIPTSAYARNIDSEMHKKVFLLDAITQARTLNVEDPGVTDLVGEATRILSGPSSDAAGDTVKLLSVLSNSGLSAASLKICDLAAATASRDGSATQQAVTAGKALGDKPCSVVILARALHAACLRANDDDMIDIVSLEGIFVTAFSAIASQCDQIFGEAKIAQAKDAALNSDASIVRAFSILCMSLQSQSTVSSQLDRVATSLKACTDRLRAQGSLNETLSGLFGLTQYTLGSVASRLIQPVEVQADSAKADTRTLQKLVQGLYSLGRKVDPSTLLGAVSERTKALVEDVCSMGEDQSIQAVKAQLTANAASPIVDVLLTSMFDETDSMDEILTNLNEKAIAKYPGQKMFFSNQMLQKVILYSKPVFAAQIACDGLLEDYRQFAVGVETQDFEKLLFRWKNSVILLKNKMQGMDDSEKAQVVKKAELLAKIVTTQNNENLSNLILSCVTDKNLSLESLKDCVEDSQLRNICRRLFGFNLLKSELSSEAKTSPRFYLVLQWLQRGLRSDQNDESASYERSLPEMSADLRVSLRNQFTSLLELVLASIADNSLEDHMYNDLVKALCWHYSAEDLEWLGERDILKIVTQGNNKIQNCWGTDNTPFSMNTADINSQPLACFCWQAARFIISQAVKACTDSTQDKAMLQKLLTQSKSLLFQSLESYLSLKKNQKSSSHNGPSDGQRAPTLEYIKSYGKVSSIQKSEQVENWSCQRCCHQNQATSRTCAFCLNEKPQVQAQQNVEQSQEFSELALWGVLGSLELLVSIAGSFTPQLIEPQNVSIVLRVAFETRTQNQVLAQKVVQAFLSLDEMNSDILEQSVEIAKSSEGSIADSLATKHQLTAHASNFVQLLFNQLLHAKSLIRTPTYDASKKLTCAVGESMRTMIRLLVDESGKFQATQYAYKQFVQSQLAKLDQLSRQQIDALLSFTPLMALNKVIFGSVCIDLNSNKKLAVVGVYQNSLKKDKINATSRGSDFTLVKALDLSSEAGSFVTTNMAKLRPILDADGEVCAKLAKKSVVFNDALAFKNLLRGDSEDDQSKKLIECYRNRGIGFMLETTGQEFISFLKSNDLMEDVVGDLSTLPTRQFKGLKSVDHLELLADILEEEVACCSSQKFIIDNESLASVVANQVVSVKRSPNEFLVWSQNDMDSQNSHVHKFSFDSQFGDSQVNIMAGVLTERPVSVATSAKQQDDQIFIVEAERLEVASYETLIMLQNSSIVITDSSNNLQQTIDRLTQSVKANNKFPNKPWSECFPSKFLVLENPDTFAKLKKITQGGTQVEQESGSVSGLEQFIERMQEVMFFAREVGDGFWMTGSKSNFKRAFIRLFNPEANLESQIRDYVSQRIENHRNALPVNSLIAPACKKIQSMGKMKLQRKGTQFTKDTTKIKEPNRFDFSSLAAESMKKKDLKMIRSFLETTVSDKSQNTASLFEAYDIENEKSRQDFYKHKVCIEEIICLQRRNHLMKMLSLCPADTLTVLRTYAEGNVSDFIYQLIHDACSVANSKSGFAQNLEEVKGQVEQLIENLKQNEAALADGLLPDLLARGQYSAQKRFKPDETKKQASRMLNPANLVFLVDLIQSKGLISGGDKAKNLRILYDLMVAMAFAYHSKEDAPASKQLLAKARSILNEHILTNLGSYDKSEADLIFNNKLLQKIFLDNDEDQRNLVNDHGIFAFEILQDLRQAFANNSGKWSGLKLAWSLDKNCQKVAKMWNIVKEGIKSPILWHNVLQKKVLADREARKYTEKWGKVYESDQYLFDNCRFKTRVHAFPEESKMIVVEKNSSLKTVKVKLQNGQETMANQARLQVMKNNSIEVPKGSWADIEIADSYPTVMYSGRFTFRLQLQSSDWKPIVDSSVCEFQQVVGSEDRIMLVGKDESIWAMGKGLQGVTDEGWIRQIEKPADCNDFQKVVYYDHIGVILTKAGKIFVSGDGFQDLIPLASGSCTCHEDQECVLKGTDKGCAKDKFKEVNIKELLPALNADEDKIVDIEVGSDANKALIVAVITESKKLFFRSNELFDVVADTFKVDHKEAKDGFQCQVRAGWNPVKVFFKDKKTEFWVTAQKEGGEEMKTFCLGPAKPIVGGVGRRNRGAAAKPQTQVKPKAQPRQIVEYNDVKGSYIKKQALTEFGYFIIDGNDDLWVKEDFDDADETVFSESDLSKQQQLRRCKWFRDKGLSCVDVKCSSKTVIVKCKNGDGEQFLYGIPYKLPTDKQKEEIQLDMLAPLSIDYDSGFKTTIVKLMGQKHGPKAQEVCDFGFSGDCAFVVLNKPQSSEESKGDEEVDSKALYYCWKNEDGEWVTKKDAPEDEIPDQCLVSRFPIRKFDDEGQEKYRLTELEKIWGMMPYIQLDESKSEVSFSSKNLISGKEKIVTATEAQIREGGQVWDLNPVIFYRTKSPVEDTNSLPCIELSKIFNSNRENISEIVIVERKKTVTTQEVQEARDNASQQTRNTLEKLQGFTEEQDREIIDVLEKQLSKRFQEAKTFELRKDDEGEVVKNTFANMMQTDFVLALNQFKLDHNEFAADTKLQQVGEEDGVQTLIPLDVIQGRAEVLLKLNMVFYKLFKLVNHKFRLDSGTAHGKHYGLKNWILPTLRYKLIQEQMKQIKLVDAKSNEYALDIIVKLPEGFEDDQEQSLEKSVFYQLQQNFKKMDDQQLIEEQDKLKNKDNAEEEKKSEDDESDDLSDDGANGAHDEEDGFQKVSKVVIADKDLNSFRMFRNHQNNAQPFKVGYANKKVVDAGGGYRDLLTSCMVELGEQKIDLFKRPPNPAAEVLILNEGATGETREDLYKCLGALLAFSFLCLQPFTVELATCVWKQIIGDKLTLHDIKEIDTKAYKLLHELYVDDKGDTSAADKDVQKYFMKYKVQTTAIRSGMDAVLDGRLDVIAYLPITTIKNRICGQRSYTRKELQAITEFKYADEESDSEKARLEKILWDVIDSYTDQEKSDFLRFVWARYRLPAHCQDKFSVHFNKQGEKTTKFKQGDEIVERTSITYKVDSIPQSHTCTFQLDSPYYTSSEQMKKQLKVAMSECQAGVEDGDLEPEGASGPGGSFISGAAGGRRGRGQGFARGQ